MSLTLIFALFFKISCEFPRQQQFWCDKTRSTCCNRCFCWKPKAFVWFSVEQIFQFNSMNWRNVWVLRSQKKFFFCSVYSLFKINFALTMKPVEYQLFHSSTNLKEKKKWQQELLRHFNSILNILNVFESQLGQKFL